jgi:cytochrome c peroxidase
MKGYVAAIALFGLWLCTTACEKQPEAYQAVQPEHFMRLPADTANPTTVAGVALGRTLFFDPQLSRDGSVSCATCHLPQRAFTDGKAIAEGVDGKAGFRNAPSLANLAWITTGFFWDGRASSLEQQALEPIENPHEMDSEWDTVLNRLRASPAYLEQFQKAFGIRQASEITKYEVAKALAQYERSLVSADSRYDRVVMGKAQFTKLEQRGRDIFFDSAENLPDGECGHCHTPPLFTDQSFVNNGSQPSHDLLAIPDRGRGGVTGVKYENGRFRVPSLRNVALTAPYMHDGSMASLEEVIDHYNRGGHPGPNVDPKIRPLGLSEKDKAALLAFLRTLTDTSFVRTQAAAISQDNR